MLQKTKIIKQNTHEGHSQHPFQQTKASYLVMSFPLVHLPQQRDDFVVQKSLTRSKLKCSSWEWQFIDLRSTCPQAMETAHSSSCVFLDVPNQQNQRKKHTQNRLYIDSSVQKYEISIRYEQSLTCSTFHQHLKNIHRLAKS